MRIVTGYLLCLVLAAPGWCAGQPDRYFKAGTVQIDVTFGDYRANIDRATAQVATLADQGARLVVLPQCSEFGWWSSAAANVEDASHQWLGQLARKHHLWLVAGITTREGDTLYSSAVIISPTGAEAGRTRRCCVPDKAQRWGYRDDPDSRPALIETEWGRLAVVMPYDDGLREADMTMLEESQPALICVPGAFASQARENPRVVYQAWSTLLAKLALRTRAWVLCANPVGRFGQALYYGASNCMMPAGRLIEAATLGQPEPMLVEIDWQWYKEL